MQKPINTGYTGWEDDNKWGEMMNMRSNADVRYIYFKMNV